MGTGVAGGGAGDFAEGGDAKIGNFHAAFFIEENVLGFDITVDDALVVGELEGFADGGDDGESSWVRFFHRGGRRGD